MYFLWLTFNYNAILKSIKESSCTTSLAQSSPKSWGMPSKCCLWNKWYWPPLQNRQHRRRESIWSYCLSIYQRRLVWHSLGYLDELITPPRLQWTKPQNPMGKIEKPNWAIIHESHHTIAFGVQHVICCQLQSKELFLTQVFQPIISWSYDFPFA